jgi:hypothetical protein
MILYGTAKAATYWGGAADGDGHWDTLANQWFLDAFGGTPAARTPQNGDTVFTDGTFTTGPASAVTLYGFDNTGILSVGNPDGMDYAHVAVTASLSIIDAAWVTDLPPNINANFNDDGFGYLNYGKISGGTVFFGGNSGSQNYGDISGGNVTINGGGAVNQVFNQGTISGGTVIFQNGATNKISATGGTLIYDDNSVLATFYLFSEVSILVGTNTIVSLDGGTTFFAAESRMASASDVRSGVTNGRDVGTLEVPTAKSLFPVTSPVASPAAG